MSTAQLVVLIYAALAIEVVLLYQALSESPSALIIAIIVAAAVIVYFLRPHPLANKRRVIAAVVLPIPTLAASYYGWHQYQEWRTERDVAAHTEQWAKENIPQSFQQQFRQRAPTGSWADMTRDWFAQQEANEAAEKAKRQKTAEESEQKARIAARLKIGDRVWVPSDSSAAREAGYFLPRNPRLYGTVVDAEFKDSADRYAIKWEEWVPSQVTWVRRDSLNPPRTK
jgi:hypothetical protein